MRQVIQLTVVAIILIVMPIDSQAQRLLVEGQTNIVKYEDSNGPVSAAGIYLGYEFNEKWSLGIAMDRSIVTHDIRMRPITTTSSDNLLGTLFNFIVGTNVDWSSTSTRDVYKKYSRQVSNYSLRANYQHGKSFRFAFGPTIQRNVILTAPTDEVTFTSGLFSDLEFDSYTNMGMMVGMDYITSFSDKFYITLGIAFQSDLLTTSSLISDTEFIGLSTHFRMGAGIRIGKSKNKNEEKIRTNKI